MNKGIEISEVNELLLNAVQSVTPQENEKVLITHYLLLFYTKMFIVIKW